MACGLNHTVAVSTDGSMVWAFGDGDYGKLGLGNSTAKSSPQVRIHWEKYSLHKFLLLLNLLHSIQSVVFRIQIINSICYTVVTKSTINNSDSMLC